MQYILLKLAAINYLLLYLLIDKSEGLILSVLVSNAIGAPA